MNPRLSLSRVIIFTGRLEEMVIFYSEVIGLELASREQGWVELGAGGCTIALHEWHGEAAEGPLKIVFQTDEVAAARALLVSRGAPMGEVVSFGEIDLCDGTDPDGNAFQLSNRVTP